MYFHIAYILYFNLQCNSSLRYANSLHGRVYISSKYARDQNTINEFLYATTINVFLDDGPVISENCRNLVFLETLF